jgi:hypothetical protein
MFPTFPQPLPLALAALALAGDALAVPTAPRAPAGQTIALMRRAPAPRTAEETMAWAMRQKANLEVKYGVPRPASNGKRSSGTNL